MFNTTPVKYALNADMKKTMFFLMITITNMIVADNLDLISLRELFYKASVSKKYSEEFARATQYAPGISNTTLSGYSGMSWLIKAHHAINPYNKLSYFFEGKALLEIAIKSDPANIELRFLRFSVQTNAPPFLGYSNSIGADKNVIL